MSLAAAKPFMRVGGQIQRKPAKLNREKQPTNFASFDRDTLIGSAELVHSVH